MLGAIIGDIVGSKYEFNNTFDYGFPLFDKGCDYTDDTICTIAIADAILNAKNKMPTDRDFKQSLQYWCKKYPHPMGAYGAGFANWVNSLNPQPYDSFGNGAAMRVSPVGYAFNDTDIVLRTAANSAKVSHSHIEGIIGASAVALAISKIRTTDKQRHIEILFETVEFFYGKEWQCKLPKQGVFDETCQGCVPLAFYICINSDSFVDAIRQAICYGGDSDTLGAIVGGLVEAMYGIPIEVKKTALNFLTPELLDVVTKFEEKYGNN